MVTRDGKTLHKKCLKETEEWYRLKLPFVFYVLVVKFCIINIAKFEIYVIII